MPYINLSNLPQLLPVVPIPSYIKPIAADPVVPVQQRSQCVTVFDPNMRTPYVENLNMSITRNITSNIILDVRYIGTLQRKNTSTINLNAANIWNNGLKEAFDAARRGEESATAGPDVQRDQHRRNGLWACREPTVNGVKQTGAMHLRAYTVLYANLANGNYIALAGTLATLNYVTTNTGNAGLPPIDTDTRGVVLRYNKFPENFIYTSPQFASCELDGEPQQLQLPFTADAGDSAADARVQHPGYVYLGA